MKTYRRQSFKRISLTDSGGCHPRSRIPFVFSQLFAFTFLLIPSMDAHPILWMADSHYVEPEETVNMHVFVGSLSESTMSLPGDILISLDLAGPQGSRELDIADWEPYVTGSIPWRLLQRIQGKLGGLDERRISSINLNPDGEGTFVLSAQIHDHRLAKTPETYMEWMEEAHMQNEPVAQLAAELGKDELTQISTRNFKTVLQSGDKLTDEATTPLKFPLEIVPLINPALVKTGDKMPFKFYFKGQPIAGQFVAAGQREGLFGWGDGNLTTGHSDSEGIYELDILDDGLWWIRLERVLPDTEDPEIDIHAYTTSLTFEIK